MVQSNGFLIGKEILTHIVFFCINLAVIMVYTPDFESPGSSQILPHTINSTLNNNVNITTGDKIYSKESLYSGWAIVACFIAFKFTNELQKVYLFYGLFKSPLYSGCSATDQLFIVLWQHIRAFTFNFLSGILLTYYVVGMVESWSEDQNSKMLEIIALIRIFRWIWQNTESALIELSFYHLYSIYAQQYVGNSFDVTRPVLWLLIGLARDRLKQMVEKLYLVVSLAVSSLEDKASRRSYAGCLFQANLLMAPIVFATVIVSSLISTPILAAFTLPLYFFAYPRPMKFWPQGIKSLNSTKTSSVTSGDAIYYEQMVPPLLRAVHKSIRAGRLGMQQPGNFLLARHEDKTVWIQIVEKGNGYLYYQAKGLELQETSCHSLEVTRIDDMFQDTFERRTHLNHFAFHTLTPLVSLPVFTYASSKNVLTGVIESPETLSLISKLYRKLLVWYILKTLIENHKSVKDQVQLINESDASPSLSENQKSSSNHLDTVQPLKASSSIEAVNLDSWPTSESSPDQDQWRSSTAKTAKIGVGTSALSRGTAYFPNKGSRTGSEESLASILGSLDLDDDLNTAPMKRKGLLPPINPIRMETHLPGGINLSVVTPEMHPKKRKSDLPTVISPSHSLDSVDNSLPGALTPPQNWIDEVKQNVRSSWDMTSKDKVLDTDWLSHCLESLLSQEIVEKYGFSTRQTATKVVLRDLIFTRKLKELIQGCWQMVYGLSSSVVDVTSEMGQSLVIRAFSGKIQSATLSEVPILLDSVALPAYRAAVKTALDQILIHGDSVVTNIDLEDCLQDIDANWHLGVEDSIAWAQAVKSQIPHLFTISTSDTSSLNGENPMLNAPPRRQFYRSHMLTLRSCSVNIGRLNSEVVRSMWASLSWELLYLTNDDDERYSIQAEERLLRNLSVEVADPPLGYPCYTSNDTRHGLEYF